MYVYLIGVGPFALAFDQRNPASEVPCGEAVRPGSGSRASSWKTFQPTNPHTHDQKNFLYLVHGVNKYNFPHLFSNSPSVYINSKALVSTSLISNTRKNTFGKFGLILEVDVNSIVQTFNVDAASWTFDSPKIVELKKQPLLFSPTELTEKTAPNRYNEILLEPSIGQKIKVVGLFVNVYAKDEWFVDDDLKNDIQKLSAQFGLPIIEISPYED
jgi:hypothetical protein